MTCGNIDIFLPIKPAEKEGTVDEKTQSPAPSPFAHLPITIRRELEELWMDEEAEEEK